MATENNSTLPLHVSIIMDGNGRWAQKRNLPRSAGHKKGAETLQEIVNELMGTLTPCTGCKYCVEYCPKELNIPTLLNMYNEYKFSFGGVQARRSILRVPEGKRPNDCLQCRACEAVCPQKIRISEELESFTGLLNE